jgi:hypothetical protein
MDMVVDRVLVADAGDVQQAAASGVSAAGELGSAASSASTSTLRACSTD